jgi:hypothetical protein
MVLPARPTSSPRAGDAAAGENRRISERRMVTGGFLDVVFAVPRRLGRPKLVRIRAEVVDLSMGGTLLRAADHPLLQRGTHVVLEGPGVARAEVRHRRPSATGSTDYGLCFTSMDERFELAVRAVLGEGRQQVYERWLSAH